MIYVKPSTHNATTVQCEMYRKLINNGIPVEVEYKIKGSRFDLIVVKNGKVIAIVETKKATKNHKLGKQYKKYSSYGVPLFYVRGMIQVSGTVKQLVNLYQNSP